MVEIDCSGARCEPRGKHLLRQQRLGDKNEISHAKNDPRRELQMPLAR